MSELKTYYLCRFTRRTGKIDTCIEALGCGLLKLWALQNTTKAKDTIVFDENGMVDTYYTGTGDFPEITEYGVNRKEGVVHIDMFCEGLLEACKKDSNKL